MWLSHSYEILDNALHGQLHTILLTVGFVLCLSPFVAWTFYKPPPNIPPLVADNYPLVGSWGFWRKRWAFTKDNAAASDTGNFSFYVGSNLVISLNGEQSRKTYFENKQLALVEGYQILLGTTPQMKVDNKKGTDIYGTSDFSAYYLNRLTRLLRRDAMAKCLPLLVEDTQIRLQELKDQAVSTTDPYKSIYNLVYQLVVRAFGCKELADNRSLLDKIVGWYDTIAESATLMPVVFPWFPSINQMKRIICGLRIYTNLASIVEKRKKGRREDDPLQELVDLNDETQNIVAVMMGAIFTAQTNSNINVAWLLVYLTTSPHWKSKVYAEIEQVANKYSPDKDLPLSKRLASLPIQAWENDFPVLDLCSKDALRINTHGSSFRQNISDEDVLLPGGQVIPPKAFATYHIGDIHLDPSVYPDPLVWDPTRHLPERDETEKQSMGSVVWGAGRHPCVGMKFAKLEQNIVLVLFLATFDDFSLCDVKGNALTEYPALNLDQYGPAKPQTDVYIKYHARE